MKLIINTSSYWEFGLLGFIWSLADKAQPIDISVTVVDGDESTEIIVENQLTDKGILYLIHHVNWDVMNNIKKQLDVIQATCNLFKENK